MLNEHVLVGLSAGVESTAHLDWCIKNYSKVTAFNLVIELSGVNNTWVHNHKIQRQYSREICKYYGIHLIEIDNINNNIIIPNTLHNTSVHQRSWLGWAAGLITTFNPSIKHICVMCKNNKDIGTVKFQDTISEDMTDKMLVAMRSKAKSIRPLAHLSKLEQFNMIPRELHKYIISCMNTVDSVACLKCIKCKEFFNEISSNWSH